ncbi:nuclear transport factor 2 family protein [Maribacter aestuarii]|uniref:nuclear transport factor 2 family protein n=1 Tax=Maribacter aestuarii TaxID=1130723 RepID=UPI00248BB36C|nr:nuclear transport factor 2 family protein [Maribacter aestuarii]
MKNLIISVIIISLWSCTGNQKKSNPISPPKIDIEKELAGIEDLRSNFVLALKEGRYEDMGKWVTTDAKTIRAGGPDFDEMFALGNERGMFPYDSIIMMPTETQIMNDSMAYDWGSSKTYYTNKDGEKVELRNSFLVILKKVDGEWKLHREVGSSVIE